MADLTLADILVAETEDQITTTLLAEMTSRGLPVSDWEVGGIARTLTAIFAKVLADFSVIQVNVAAGGLLDDATGNFLSVLCSSNFQTDRKPSTFAQASVTLSDTGGGGPYTITVGQLVAKTSTGLLYRNTTGGTLNNHGTLALTFQAESPGTAYNVATNAINALATPLAGVVITASTMTVTAVDEESDDDLRARAKLQWALLATGAVADTYVRWALDSDPSIRRVLVTTDATPGQVDVTLAAEDGTVSGAAVTAAQAYIDARRPLTVTAVVAAAVAHPIDITATIKVKAANLSAAQAEVSNDLTVMLRGVDVAGTVYLAKIIETLMLLPGAVNVILSLPAADVVLGANEVATLGAFTPTWIAV